MKISTELKDINVETPRNQQRVLVWNNVTGYYTLDQMFYDNGRFIYSYSDCQQAIDINFVAAWAVLPEVILGVFE
jgi:uncharacterized protein YeeX (DUF496 family)